MGGDILLAHGLDHAIHTLDVAPKANDEFTMTGEGVLIELVLASPEVAQALADSLTT